MKAQFKIQQLLSRSVTLQHMLSVFLGCLLLSGCRTSIPKWDGKIYAGDSANEGVSRKQSDEVIRCDSPEIDAMLCMTGSDFKSFYETYVLGCQKWPRGIQRMSIQQAWSILDGAYRRDAAQNVIQVSDEIEPETSGQGVE